MNSLLIPTDKGKINTLLTDIIRIQSNSNYCKIYFTNQRTLTVAKVLQWFDDNLSATHFSRIHKSHLVNLLHVKDHSLVGNKILLNNGEEICVSKRRLKQVRALFEK